MPQHERSRTRALRRLVVAPGALALALALGAAPAGADELPQHVDQVDELPQHVDELPPVPELPEHVDELAPAPADPVEPGSGEPGSVEPAGDLLVLDEETGGLSATGWALLVLALVILTAPAWLLWAVPATFGVGVVALVRKGKDRRLEREIDEGLRMAPGLSDASREAFGRERAARRRAQGPARAPAGERGGPVTLDDGSTF